MKIPVNFTEDQAWQIARDESLPDWIRERVREDYVSHMTDGANAHRLQATARIEFWTKGNSRQKRYFSIPRTAVLHDPSLRAVMTEVASGEGVDLETLAWRIA